MRTEPKACIVGAFEHPTRKADDKSLAQLHAEVAKGALEDAGLSKDDVDGYFCDTEAPGLGPLSMVDYLGLKVRHMDNTDTGGSAYLLHVAHAAQAIAAGKCRVALITLAGRPRSAGLSAEPHIDYNVPDMPFEMPYGPTVVNTYGMCAMRHMHHVGAAGVDQGGGVAACAAQPERDAAQARHGRRGARLADDFRPAAPARLLRGERRRRRAGRRRPRGGARAEAAGGARDRQRRG